MSKKVLIVDDEQLIADAYELVLSKAGYKVFTADRGEAGLKIVEAEDPDIVLLDMLMPEMNGIDFLKILQEKKLLSGRKIIAFSNIENPEVVSAAKKMGVMDYLLKVNYTPKEVTELVTKLLREK